MQFDFSQHGEPYRVQYTPHDTAGTLVHVRSHAAWPFRYAWGDPRVVWGPTEQPAAELAVTLACALYGKEPLRCVRIEPDGWAVVHSSEARDARCRTDLVEQGADGLLHRVTDDVLCRLHLPDAATLLVCEPRDSELRAHPMDRSARVALARPLYGELLVFAQRDGIPWQCSRALLRDVADRFNELSPLAAVTQAARYVQRLRQKNASWQEVERATQDLWERTNTYEADRIGSAPPFSSRKESR